MSTSSDVNQSRQTETPVFATAPQASQQPIMQQPVHPYAAANPFTHVQPQQPFGQYVQQQQYANQSVPHPYGQPTAQQYAHQPMQQYLQPNPQQYVQQAPQFAPPTKQPLFSDFSPEQIANLASLMQSLTKKTGSDNQTHSAPVVDTSAPAPVEALNNDSKKQKTKSKVAATSAAVAPAKEQSVPEVEQVIQVHKPTIKEIQGDSPLGKVLLGFSTCSRADSTEKFLQGQNSEHVIQIAMQYGSDEFKKELHQAALSQVKCLIEQFSIGEIGEIVNASKAEKTSKPAKPTPKRVPTAPRPQRASPPPKDNAPKDPLQEETPVVDMTEQILAYEQQLIGLREKHALIKQALEAVKSSYPAPLESVEEGDWAAQPIPENTDGPNHKADLELVEKEIAEVETALASAITKNEQFQCLDMMMQSENDSSDSSDPSDPSATGTWSSVASQKRPKPAKNVKVMVEKFGQKFTLQLFDKGTNKAKEFYITPEMLTANGTRKSPFEGGSNHENTTCAVNYWAIHYRIADEIIDTPYFKGVDDDGLPLSWLICDKHGDEIETPKDPNEYASSYFKHNAFTPVIHKRVNGVWYHYYIRATGSKERIPDINNLIFALLPGNLLPMIYKGPVVAALASAWRRETSDANRISQENK